MDKFTVEYYDLLSRALGGSDSARLQGFFDEVMALKYNSLQLDGFAFEPDMQLDFTYEQLQKELGINVMAQYYDLDSPAIPFGTEGMQLSTGKIPRMKTVEYFNEDKYRKMLIDEQRFGAGSDAVSGAAFRHLYNTVDTLVGGHTNSLTYQRHQIVSKGKFVLNDTNNPYGVKGLTFAAHVPAANFNVLAGTKRWWTSYDASTDTYSSEGADCDPIKDLQTMVKVAKKKGVRGHFEVNDVYMDAVLGHSKIQKAIGLSLYPLADPTTVAGNVALLGSEQKIEALGRIVGAPFKVIDSLVSVEKWNATTKKLERPIFNAFESNVIVFVPDGSLGVVKTVEPIIMGNPITASFYGGRLRLIVTADASKKCQAFETEMTSLVIPDKPQYMWYLTPYAAS